MRISQAAHLVGVPAHVLRHWEDVGVLAPDRAAGNRRDFTEQHVNEARIIRRLRLTGVGLSTIRALRSGNRDHRSALLTSTAEELSAQAARMARAAAYLSHVTECRHPVIDECVRCREFADDATSNVP